MADALDDTFFTSAVPTKQAPALDDSFFTSAIPAAAAKTAGPKSTDAEEGWGAALARHAAQGGDALIRGLLGTVGLPGTLDTVAGHYAVGPNYKSLLPTSQELQQQLTKGEASPSFAGLPQQPVTQQQLAPRNAAERYGTAAARGLGGAIPALGLGMAPAIAAASGVGSGLAGQTGHDFAGAPGEIAGSIVGGGLGQSAATAFGRASLGKVAQQLGHSSTMQEAGTALQQQLSDWVENTHPQWQHQIWAPVDAAVPSKTAVPLTNFKAALGSIQPNTGPLQGLSNTISSNTVNALSKALDGLGSDPTWANASAFRSQLGEMLSSPKLQKDLSDQQISRLYASLTSDMRTAAHGLPPGPDGQSPGAMFDDANANSSALYRMLDKKGPVGKVINDSDLRKNTIPPEKAAASLLTDAKRGSTTLDQLRMLAPDATDELGAAFLRQPNSAFHGLPPESQQALVSSPLLRQQAIKASKAAAGESTKEALASPLHALVGETAGEALGTMLGHVAGFAQNSFLPPEAGKLAGLMAPYAYKAARSGLQQPERLQGMGLGLGEALGR